MKKTPVEILEEVLDKQYELFETAVKEERAMAILDIGAEVGKTCSALLQARRDEASARYLNGQTETREKLAYAEEERLKEMAEETDVT